MPGFAVTLVCINKSIGFFLCIYTRCDGYANRVVFYTNKVPADIEHTVIHNYIISWARYYNKE